MTLYKNIFITISSAIFAQMNFINIIRDSSAVVALIVGILTIIKLIKDLKGNKKNGES